ncbi:hypothetical protein [Aquipuribacter hungaricus]|uniref:Uncharacterized protein n=1 Tax=Aquipuribacter hungaricus TaxID=545624 RepID=A0ABV7WBY4_9MICO
MNSVNPVPAPPQPPPPLLSLALDLLDGLLVRGDVPAAVRRDITDVLHDLVDLVDVRPPSPPTAPIDRRRPWSLVVQEAVDLLHGLIDHTDPDSPPALTVRYALAIRALRGTTRHASSPGIDGPGQQG